MLGSPGRSALLSALLHAAAIALILLATRVTGTPSFVRPRSILLEPLEMPRFSTAVPHKRGGGGARDETPPSAGRLPRAAAREFTPPVLKPANADPQLTIEPTLVAQPDAQLPAINLAQFGVPDGTAGPPSQGPGAGGGFGNGAGGGNGDGGGPGFGPGYNGGAGAGGDGGSGSSGSLTAPVLLRKTEPEYSDEARRARLQGMVVLWIEIDAHGQPRNIVVRQGLGMGLDERAVETVRQWRFRPAARNGKPIAVRALVEVSFRLL
jgi:TonB family protein